MDSIFYSLFKMVGIGFMIQAVWGKFYNLSFVETTFFLLSGMLLYLFTDYNQHKKEKKNKEVHNR